MVLYEIVILTILYRSTILYRLTISYRSTIVLHMLDYSIQIDYCKARRVE